MDMKKERAKLVKKLKEEGYIVSGKVEKAMLSVPRELFIEGEDRALAYLDRPLEIGSGQTISAPHMVAMITELLETTKNSTVMEIGSGSGYQAAVLSGLVKHVYTTERIPEVAERAERNLKETGIINVTIKRSDGSRGLEEHAPYDRIMVTCATPEIFVSWKEQLRDGGIIVAPLEKNGVQELVRVRKTPEGFVTEEHGRCVFVPLVRE